MVHGSQPSGDDALDDHEFAALMARLDPFPGDRRVVAGVSGGADSMAMAALLSRWGRPLAAIVDHGLRPESGQEAALTASRLQSIGVPSRILRARIAPGAGVAERARRARYALLLQACREAGCADLVLAHHAQDQAETVRMREDAGSGPAGRAGMSAISYDDGARRLRPLLPVAPRRLRATLRQAELGWVEDPTNRDLRTLRARLRAGMDTAALDAAFGTAAELGRVRQEAEEAAADELAAVCLRPEGFAYAPAPLGSNALSALIWMLSGRPYPPAPGKTKWLGASTLHGVVVQPAGRLGPGWLLAREPGSVRPPVSARAGARWDRRFVLGCTTEGATIGALGLEAARFRCYSDLPSVVLRGLPALRRGGEVIAIPHLDFPSAATCRSLNVRFIPARPAAGAAFFAPA